MCWDVLSVERMRPLGGPGNGEALWAVLVDQCHDTAKGPWVIAVWEELYGFYIYLEIFLRIFRKKMVACRLEIFQEQNHFFFVAILWKTLFPLRIGGTFKWIDGGPLWSASGTNVHLLWKIEFLYRMFEERLGSSKNAGLMPLISRQRFRHIIVSSTSLVFVLKYIIAEF